MTVFEANDYAGGHTHTVRVDTADETHHVDTGFIVHNDRNYPRFVRLLETVGVATQPAPMSFSVSDGRGGLEYNGASANGLFANRANLVRPSFHRMILDLMKFNREAPALVGLNGSGPSLGRFLHDGGYSRAFVERLIVPQASAVWSADPASMWEFPASLLAEFFDNHGMFGFTGRPQWRAVSGGSARYVERLTRDFERSLLLSAPVRRVERFHDRVEVTPEGAEPIGFDEVVLATHSDQALAMLADPSDAERDVLGAIRYQPNNVVLHTDRSVLPRRARAWAAGTSTCQDEPVGPDLAHLPHEPRSRRSTPTATCCVTLNRPRGRTRPVIRTLRVRPSRVHAAAVRAQGRYDDDRRARRRPLLRRVLGLRVPRGRRGRARSRCASASRRPA